MSVREVTYLVSTQFIVFKYVSTGRAELGSAITTSDHLFVIAAANMVGVIAAYLLSRQTERPHCHLSPPPPHVSGIGLAGCRRSTDANTVSTISLKVYDSQGVIM